jgi:hypothetical protein
VTLAAEDAQPEANGGVRLETPEARPTIHLPDPELGAEEDSEQQAAEPGENGAEPQPPRKRTRRGSRGGRNRRKRPAAAAPEPTAEPGPGS